MPKVGAQGGRGVHEMTYGTSIDEDGRSSAASWSDPITLVFLLLHGAVSYLTFDKLSG